MKCTNNINYWNEIKNKKKGSPLTFIHTPKCGGSFVCSVLSLLNIKNKGHNRRTQNDGITFTVIRNPIQRFESLMNYRLSDINSALGISQLKKINQILKRRNEIYNFYNKHLKSFTKFIHINRYSGYLKHSFHLYVVHFKIENFK